MAITLLLLVVGLFLVRELHAKALIEDCLMSGRINCDSLVTRRTSDPRIESRGQGRRVELRTDARSVPAH